MYIKDAQSWTRCRLPVSRLLPFDLMYNKDEGGWRTPLRHLLAAPGYEFITCGRNVKDPEEVLFIITWRDSTSLQAFTESDGYSSYFEALGIHESSPGSFLRLQPPNGAGILDERAMITIFSFEHPVNEETRRRFELVRGLDVVFPDRPLRFPLTYARVWIEGPQAGKDGQLVEHAMLIQPFSIAEESREGQNEIQEHVSKDPWATERFYGRVKELGMKIVEEVTWDIGSAEYDD